MRAGEFVQKQKTTVVLFMVSSVIRLCLRSQNDDKANLRTSSGVGVASEGEHAVSPLSRMIDPDGTLAVLINNLSRRPDTSKYVRSVSTDLALLIHIRSTLSSVLGLARGDLSVEYESGEDGPGSTTVGESFLVDDVDSRISSHLHVRSQSRMVSTSETIPTCGLR